MLGLFAFEAVDVLSRVALQIRGQGFAIALLIGFRETALQALHRFHQQLQAAHLQHVAGDLGAVHALLAALDRQSRQLLIGDVLKNLAEQVHAVFQVVAAQSLAEVV